jgi:hypothetical protein
MSIIYFFLGRPSRDCSIIYVWLSVVGSTVSENFCIVLEGGRGSVPQRFGSTGIVLAASDSMEVWVGEEL